MERPPEELRLNDSYHFRVTVDSDGSRFAGELSLSPTECSLVVRGDLSEGRSATLDWRGIDEILCESFDSTFFLHGLRGVGATRQFVQRHPKPVSHLEIRYRVSHVIYGRAYGSRRPTFVGLDFCSPSIAQWVGHTRKQDEIAKKYQDGSLFDCAGEPLIEFLQPVTGFGCVAVVYRPSSQYSSEDFSMGLKFPPVLSLAFEGGKTAPEVIDVVNEIDTLFSFLFGSRLDVDRIKLITSDGQRVELSLYSSRMQEGITGRKYPFFPLGMNLQFDQLRLPPLPTELFSTYFRLPKAEKSYFEKYIKYRHLSNPEERFLGFFRLLEKLCFQKESFLPEDKLTALLERAQPFLTRYFDDKKNVQRVLGRMVGWNNSKLNTAGCITRFLKTLPTSLLKRWIYGASNINGICTLRNDLTHANEAEPATNDIEQKAKFIEVLLVIRLLIAVGVSVEKAASIAPRLPGHRLIEPPAEVRVTTERA